ncbi:MAG: hypothetical protein P4M14_08755 [Gammaproteobacteria bacterium]|nr:hypothetical protein [Gammaproteobacteria bacterium]
MKLTFDLLRQRLLLVLFFALISAMLLAPIGSNTLIPMILDYLNHLNAIIQAKAALAEGQFPLRVATGDQDGWRYPFYQFYSPTSYFVASSIYRWLTPSNPFIAYKATIWLAYVIGGLYMNRLSYWFVKSKPAALLASVVYLTAPYNIILINHLGAFNEAIAIGLLPAVVYYTLQRYYYPHRNKTLIQTALVWYLLITIHLITFLCTSFFVGLMLFLITIKNRRHWHRLIDVGIAYLFACFLAMWFLAPIAVLAKYFVINHSFSSLAVFNAYRPFLSSLLSPVASLAYTETEGVNGVMDIITRSNPALGLFSIAGVVVCFYALWHKQKLASKRANYWMSTLVVLFLLGFLLAWSPIDIWGWLPQSFRVIQYSWRLIGQTVWIGALLFGFAVTWLFNNKLDDRHVAIGLLLIVTTAGAWFPVFERNYAEFADFVKHPVFAAHPDIYLIDAQKYLPFVNTIDSLVVDAFSPLDSALPHSLKLNTPYLIPLSAFALTKNPEVLVKGNMPKAAKLEKARLTAYINGKAMANYEVQQNRFEWRIPLTKADILKTKKPIVLQFKLDGVSANNKLDILVEKIVLSGFLSKTEAMDVAQTKHFCQQQKENTVCQIDVPHDMHLIELPVLYYPQLLQVILNNHVVSYGSVMYQGRLIVGVMPEPGKVNTIVVQFRGLPWANFMSKVTWYLWLLFLCFIAVKILFFKMKTLTSRHIEN